jgi:hypothetical protein
MFENKIALLIPGVRGLSNQHADELSDLFKKAGGRVALPERGKLNLQRYFSSIQGKHQGHHEGLRLHYNSKDQVSSERFGSSP